MGAAAVFEIALVEMSYKLRLRSQLGNNAHAAVPPAIKSTDRREVLDFLK